MKIYAPVKDANGVWASVRFVNGVGETDDPRLIEWFRTHGYRVPIEEKPSDIGSNPDESDLVEINKLADEPELMGYNERVEPSGETDELDSMTSEELRDLAKSMGYGIQIGNTRNREKLIKVIRG